MPKWWHLQRLGQHVHMHVPFGLHWRILRDWCAIIVFRRLWLYQGCQAYRTMPADDALISAAQKSTSVPAPLVLSEPALMLSTALPAPAAPATRAHSAIPVRMGVPWASVLPAC